MNKCKNKKIIITDIVYGGNESLINDFTVESVVNNNPMNVF
jgi:hypothetical protein